VELEIGGAFWVREREIFVLRTGYGIFESLELKAVCESPYRKKPRDGYR
jgi:hypothetical protein